MFDIYSKTWKNKKYKKYVSRMGCLIILGLFLSCQNVMCANIVEISVMDKQEKKKV